MAAGFREICPNLVIRQTYFAWDDRAAVYGYVHVPSPSARKQPNAGNANAGRFKGGSHGELVA